MIRAGSTVVLIFPNVEALATFTSAGKLNTGWFQRLKKSARNWLRWRSVMWKFLATEKSQFCWNGPRKAFRGTFPNPVMAFRPSTVEPDAFGTTAAGLTKLGFRKCNRLFWIGPLKVMICCTVVGVPGVQVGRVVF